VLRIGIADHHMALAPDALGWTIAFLGFERLTVDSLRHTSSVAGLLKRFKLKKIR
jgi:hypothetical protein